MTENEREILQLIRESKDPAKALEIAIDITTRYLQDLQERGLI